MALLSFAGQVEMKQMSGETSIHMDTDTESTLRPGLSSLALPGGWCRRGRGWSYNNEHMGAGLKKKGK